MFPRSKRLQADLAVALDSLGVVRRGDQDELATLGGYLVAPRLRLGDHFDLEPDLLVVDTKLGTVGLVYEVGGKSSPTSTESLSATVKELIDSSAYLRHLLITELKLGRSLPLTVELVFLVRDEAESLKTIGKALGTVARETSVLDALGINLLLHRGGDVPFLPADLRRAFSWLLHATRSWYEQARPKPSAVASDGPVPRLTAVELENYRLPGSRRLGLCADVKAHLVFGQNGSGKSSLVEALELAVTGYAERLFREKDYDQVIRHCSAKEPASVKLLFHGRAPAVFSIAAEGPDACLGRGLRGTSFRLDQTVMDRLTRGGDAQRAEVFLQSFFPAEGVRYHEYNRARQEAAETLARLPPVLRERLAVELRVGEDPEEAVVRALAWVEDGEAQLESSVAVACLPLPLVALERLVALSPEMGQLLSSWRAALPRVKDAPEVLGRIDEVLERLRPALGDIQNTLRISREGLQRVAAWRAVAGRGLAAGDFEPRLQAWLELSSLVDLAERHLQVVQVLEEARSANWSSPAEAVGPFAPFPPGRDETARLAEQAKSWARERDECFQQLISVESPEGRRTEAAKADLPRLSPAQRRQLDVAGGWLLPSQTANEATPLGQLVDRALLTGEAVSAGDIAIGAEGWAEPLLDRLRELAEAVAQWGSSTASGVSNFAALRETFAKHQALREAGVRMRETFLRQIAEDAGGAASPLLDALNELMALFTPARWAYGDIALEYRSGKEGDELGFCTSGDRALAALRLNTAELNLFTVALFFLCALQVENPLRLLILDDPLQNMDELTVTTLARGLAKLTRLWPAEWQLLLLFHGHEDLERFREEMPLAVYRLPWLRPTGGSAEPEIRVSQPLYEATLQSFADLLGEAGATKAAPTRKGAAAQPRSGSKRSIGSGGPLPDAL